MKVIINTADFPDYLKDASNFRGSCERIYLPQNTDDISEAIDEIRQDGLNLTLSGNGTGLTGGRVPEQGAVLHFGGIKKEPIFSENNKLVTVPAGLALMTLLEKVEERGLYFPPDPTEKSCSCGGIVATNASGAKSFSYGPVRNFVEGLNLILADGKAFSIKRGDYIARGTTFSDLPIEGLNSFSFAPIAMPDVKNASGYFLNDGMDLIDLFIGSEGTLAITTEITFKLLDKPLGVLSCLAYFTSEEGALDFVTQARDHSLTNKPRALEFFDANALTLLRTEYSFLKADVGAAVWFEYETGEEAEDTLLESIETEVKACGGTGEIITVTSPKERKELEKMRHGAAYKVNEYIASKNLRKLGTDTAVPHRYFKEYYRFCKESVLKAGLDYVIYGHFGNSHLHLNMLPRDVVQFEKGRKIYGELCRRAIDLGGTVSAEHGIGKIKKEFLKLMYGESGIAKMKAIKALFDPNFSLGRGNLFEL